jgi:hypothetical protein
LVNNIVCLANKIASGETASIFNLINSSKKEKYGQLFGVAGAMIKREKRGGREKKKESGGRRKGRKGKKKS